MKNNELNRIKIVDDKIELSTLDDSIIVNEIPRSLFFDVTSICLEVKKDTNLVIEYSTRKATKLDVTITVDPGINFELSEYRFGKNFKIRNRYTLLENSYMNVCKFYDVSGIKEMNMIYLNGYKAKIDYNFKTISTGFEKYNYTVYHNAPKTESYINNNGANINKGNLQFNVSSFGMGENKECIINQNSRIVNYTNNKCQINPNLFIDNYDVTASHSAYIGSFSYDELFYLMSRGIDEKKANHLLITGFLTKDVNTYIAKKVIKNINKYWR